jgi:hypothetical protein
VPWQDVQRFSKARRSVTPCAIAIWPESSKMTSQVKISKKRLIVNALFRYLCVLYGPANRCETPHDAARLR